MSEYEIKQTTVRLRERGQITIPQSVRDKWAAEAIEPDVLNLVEILAGMGGAFRFAQGVCGYRVAGHRAGEDGIEAMEHADDRERLRPKGRQDGRLFLGVA